MGWSLAQNSPTKCLNNIKKPPVWGGQGPFKDCRAMQEGRKVDWICELLFSTDSFGNLNAPNIKLLCRCRLVIERFQQFWIIVTVQFMLSGSLVAPEWRVLRLPIEKKASSYWRYLRIYWICNHGRSTRVNPQELLVHSFYLSEKPRFARMQNEE
jgi:hypothetical protein